MNTSITLSARKRILSLTSITVALVLMAPLQLLAQEIPGEPTPDPAPVVSEPVNAPTDVTPSVEVVISDPAQPAVDQSDQNVGQDTSSPQSTDPAQGASSSIIENTFNPHDASVSTSTPEVVEIASTTDATPIDSSTVGSTDNIVEIVEVIDPVVEVIEAAPVVTITEVMTVDNQAALSQATAIENVEPDPEFSFSVGAGAIATKKNPKWKELSGDKKKSSAATINEVPSIDLNNEDGTVDLDGVCSDKYFVVLLYKNTEDYDVNPASYIFNKAFDCVSGSYHYSIKELPDNLKDGTYYLMIAGQGDTGSWYPITALVPISINNKQNE